MKKISAIILNWNSWKETFSCLDSVADSAVDNFKLEVILIDNASKEKQTSRIEKYQSFYKSRNLNFFFIANQKNLGFSGGNNVGFKSALENGCNYLAVLNNDVIIHKFLFKNLFNEAEKENASSILAPKIYFAKGFEFHKKRYQKKDLGKIIWYAGGVIDWQNIYCSHRGVDEVDLLQYQKIEETDFASGCCMFIPKDIVEKTGSFDERFFLYFEDVDYCLRAKKMGFKVKYVPQAFLWHKNAQSAGFSGSSLQNYYQSRNRLLFGAKYGNLRTKLALLKEAAGFIGKDKIKTKALFDFLFGKFGKREI